MNCEKCLHKSVCAVAATPKTEIFNCEDYKDEELYIKLLCEIGDTVFTINKTGDYESDWLPFIEEKKGQGNILETG